MNAGDTVYMVGRLNKTMYRGIVLQVCPGYATIAYHQDREAECPWENHSWGIEDLKADREGCYLGPPQPTRRQAAEQAVAILKAESAESLKNQIHQLMANTGVEPAGVPA